MYHFILIVLPHYLTKQKYINHQDFLWILSMPVTQNKSYMVTTSWHGVLELTAIPTTHAEIFYTTCIDQDCIRPVKQQMLLMSVW